MLRSAVLVPADSRGVTVVLHPVLGTGAVSGTRSFGGLVGHNSGAVTQCHGTGAVSGTGWHIGGLVGYNSGTVTECYRAGRSQVLAPTASAGWWVKVTRREREREGYCDPVFLGHADVRLGHKCRWHGQDHGRDADGQDVSGCRLGLRGRDGQRHGGHLVDQ